MMKWVAGFLTFLLVAILMPIGLAIMYFFTSGSASASECEVFTATSSNKPIKLDKEQIANAQIIIGVSKTLRVPLRGRVVAIAASMQEAKLRSLDYGDRDSLGLFQMRPSQGWGTAQQVQDPVYASAKFFDVLAKVPGWQSMTINDAAQKVERSGHPHAYAQWTELAQNVVHANLGVPPVPVPGRSPAGQGQFAAAGAGDGCGGGGDAAPFTGVSASCSEDDPTGPDGCLTPATAHMLAETKKAFPNWEKGIGCWDPHLWNKDSDHNDGKACDLHVSTGGVMPNAKQKALGDRLSAWYIANANKLGINYVIFYGRIWNSREGWHKYTGGGVYTVVPTTVKGIVGGHFDHVHVNMAK